MEAVKIEGCVVKLVERLNENDNETTEWVMLWYCGGLMI